MKTTKKEIREQIKILKWKKYRIDDDFEQMLLSVIKDKSVDAFVDIWEREYNLYAFCLAVSSMKPFDFSYSKNCFYSSDVFFLRCSQITGRTWYYNRVKLDRTTLHTNSDKGCVRFFNDTCSIDICHNGGDGVNRVGFFKGHSTGTFDYKCTINFKDDFYLSENDCEDKEFLKIEHGSYDVFVYFGLIGLMKKEEN